MMPYKWINTKITDVLTPAFNNYLGKNNSTILMAPRKVGRQIHVFAA